MSKCEDSSKVQNQASGIRIIMCFLWETKLIQTGKCFKFETFLLIVH